MDAPSVPPAASTPLASTAEPSLPWQAVTKHGFSDLFPSSRLFARGNRLARLDGDTIRWDDCRLSMSDEVAAVNHLHRTRSEDVVAWVSVGIQASSWMRWSRDDGTWSDIPGRGGAKRTQTLHTQDDLFNLWLFQHDHGPHDSVDWAVQQLDPRRKKLALTPHPQGCVQQGVTFVDFRVHAGTATLLCDRGIEQWTDIGGATSSPVAASHAALPKGMTLEAGFFDCGDGRAPRWAGLVPTDGGVVLIAPSIDGGTRTARFRDGSWDELGQVTTEVVSAYLSGREADVFTTASEQGDGQCGTQLWKRSGGSLEKSGSAIPGSKAWLLSNPEGWPTVVTRDAILRVRPSGEVIAPLSEGDIHDAAMVSGEVWLESDRGWIARRRYLEEGSPDEPCGDGP